MIEIILSLSALFVSIVLVCSTIKNHRFMRFHDLVKWNHQLWAEIDNLKEKRTSKKIIASKILNFFEYVSYCYIENKVKRKEILKLFKGELIKNYEAFEIYLGNQNYLIRLYKFFKNMEKEKELKKPKGVREKIKIFLGGERHILNYSYSYMAGIFASIFVAMILGHNPLKFSFFTLMGFIILTYMGGLFCISMIKIGFLINK